MRTSVFGLGSVVVVTLVTLNGLVGCGGGDSEGGATSGGSTASTTGAGGSGGESASATSGTGGAGGTGGASATSGTGGSGGGGIPECEPATVEDCYSGSVDTLDVGICKGGQRTCAESGFWGACLGEVLPQAETCQALTDEDCDGEVNEGGVGCVCLPGSTQSCYTGAPETEGVGVCVPGLETCNVTGEQWGTCEGEILPQIENCLFGEDENCNGLAELCTGTFGWSKTFGDVKAQTVKGVAGFGSPAGGGVMTGFYQGTVDFGGGQIFTAVGSNDIFLAAYDYLGDVLFAKSFGDVAAQNATAVAVDSQGNVVITGDIAGTTDFGGGGLVTAGLADLFVAKFDKAGNYLWAQRFGDALVQSGLAVAIGANDSVVVTGSFDGNMDFGGAVTVTSSAGANTDAFVVMFDAAGAPLWAKSFGDGVAQSARGVAVAPNGDVVITGDLAGAADFGGGTLTSQGSSDIFVARYDAAGTPLWSKIFGNASAQNGVAVATDSVGNVLLTGDVAGKADFGAGLLTSAGSTDLFVAKLDGAGTHLFSKLYGNSGAQTAKGIAADALDAILVTGDVAGTIDFGGGVLTSAGSTDIVFAKLDPLGAFVWAKLVGDVAAQTGAGVSTSLTFVLGAGNYQGKVDFGGGAITSVGSTDSFLVRMDP
jgi:hypothetical protein